jgi:TetR/AcrR family transcriptional repressor of nem operon
MARPREFDERSALQHAMQVFWRKGYEATSVADLLKATGLSKSSLYQTFTDKRTLFLSALDAYRQHRMTYLRTQLNDGRPARESIQGFFREILQHAADKERPYGCMNCNEAVELGPDDAEVRKLVAADFQAVEDLFCDAIQRGQRDGSIRNQENARTLARFLTVNLQGLQVMARARGDARRITDNVKVMMTSFDHPSMASPAQAGVRATHAMRT